MAKKTYTDDDLVTMLLAVAEMAAARSAKHLAASLRQDAEMIAGDDFDPLAGVRFDDLEGGTDDPGFNYGRGQTHPESGGPVNTDPDTDIHYGIIPANAVGQAWYDSSEPVDGDFEIECSECGQTIETENGVGPDTCPHCEADVEAEFQQAYEFSEPVGFEVNDGEYVAHQGSDRDIFITKSPYFTYAQFCSLCAPGAVYLLNWLRQPVEENRGYCFGHDWFEDDKAPYPVFSVKTGERVYSEGVTPRPSRQDLDEALLVTGDLAEELGRHALAKRLRAGAVRTGLE